MNLRAGIQRDIKEKTCWHLLVFLFFAFYAFYRPFLDHVVIKLVGFSRPIRGILYFPRNLSNGIGKFILQISRTFLKIHSADLGFYQNSFRGPRILSKFIPQISRTFNRKFIPQTSDIADFSQIRKALGIYLAHLKLNVPII